jgi:hypothetical protein
MAGQSIIDFATSGYTSCAITSSYRGYCWGNNVGATVGDNTTTNRTVPTSLYAGGGLAGVNLKRIGIGVNGGCALSTNSQVFCWGNSIYELWSGHPRTGAVLIPPTLMGYSELSTHTWVDIEIVDHYSFCVISTTAVLKCFSNVMRTFTAPTLNAGEVVVSMSARDGYEFSFCALTNQGRVLCNGPYWYKPATAATTIDALGVVNLPVAAVSVRIGSYQACAVLVNGGMSCWGSGFERSVGLGVTGRPAVQVLPAGSGITEAAVINSYPDGQIMTRKANGQLATYKISDLSDGVISPTFNDGLFPKTPRITLKTPSYYGLKKMYKEHYDDFCSRFERTNCNTVFTAQFSLDLESTTTEDVIYRVYTNATLRNLKSQGIAENDHSFVGPISALANQWVTFTATGPFGETTTSAVKIDRLHLFSIKQSLKKSKKYSISSIFIVEARGTRSWKASSGCSIKGKYLHTTRSKTCKIRLTINGVPDEGRATETRIFDVK